VKLSVKTQNQLHGHDASLSYSCSGNMITTRSVAAGFGRHGMPPPAANDIGTALGQDGSDWSCNRATLKVMAPVADAGRRPPSIYQVWSS